MKSVQSRFVPISIKYIGEDKKKTIIKIDIMANLTYQRINFTLYFHFKTIIIHPIKEYNKIIMGHTLQ